MNQRGGRNSGKTVALGGILLALSVVCLYAASVVPGVELTMFLAGSFLISVMMIESKGKGGWLVYGAATFLGLIVVPNKIVLVPYVLFFGLYPILKSIIERKVFGKMQLAVKIGYFTTAAIGVIKVAQDILFGGSVLGNAPFIVILIVGEIFFVVFDWVLSVLISYYYRRFHGVI